VCVKILLIMCNNIINISNDNININDSIINDSNVLIIIICDIINENININVYYYVIMCV